MTAPADVVRLMIPAKAEYVVLSRLVLTGLTRVSEMSQETLADLKIAVTEACNRSIRSASGAEAALNLRYELGDDEIVVEVRCSNGSMAPTSRSQEDGDADAEADALGLALIRAVVDGLEIEEAAEANGRLIVRKRLTG
jgi:serine/threonine-protein kinase RsbW